ncbi:MAG TPA: DUF4142 domain-containing protein [Rhizomicrobium sp.]|nr:DUF4142 domain-containing protein [Rhizomicrobium sp.]
MSRSLLMVATCLVLAAPAYAMSPRAFVTYAIKGDNSEIMLGQMATQQASSQGVKNFGQTLVTDHTQAKQQMTSVADRIGVTPPNGPADEAKQEQQKLQGMQGPAFDREFVRYMVKDHKKDIAKFRREARSDRGPVGQMAAKQIPVLEKHLHIAMSLQQDERSGRYSGER